MVSAVNIRAIPLPTETDDDDAAEEDVDEDGGMTLNEAPETHPKLAPRWPTRVFATECVRRIVAVCEGRRAHFDLQLARQLRDKTGEGRANRPTVIPSDQ